MSTITHRFKNHRDCWGNGYSAYIEDRKLVLEYYSPHEGGVYYRGDYWGAIKHLAELKKYDEKLYDDITRYFEINSVDVDTNLKNKLQFDADTKTILFNVGLYMDDGHTIHKVSVRGRFEADVIKKLTPPIPEVLVLQKTSDYSVFAVRSDKISAIEFY